MPGTQHPSLLAGVGASGRAGPGDAWSHEDFRPPARREVRPAVPRRRGPHQSGPLPARKTLEDFDFRASGSVRSDVVSLGPSTSSMPSQTPFPGPTGHGQEPPVHSARHPSLLAGHRVAFATARSGWTGSAAAHDAGKSRRSCDGWGGPAW